MSGKPPEAIAAMMQRFPFAQLIGMELEQLARAQCVLGLTLDPSRHHNPQGVVHGSVLHALADTCMGMALYTTLGVDDWCATIEMKISYLRAVGAGRLRAESQLLHHGKRVAFLSSTVMADGELIATASGSFAVFERPRAG